MPRVCYVAAISGRAGPAGSIGERVWPNL